MKNKKSMIIFACIVGYIAISVGGFFIRPTEFRPDDRKATLVSVSDSGGTDHYGVPLDSRIVKYNVENLEYVQQSVCTSKFLKKNGVLDAKPGDELVYGHYIEYYRPGILMSALSTLINIIDVKNPHDKVLVIPFTKQVYKSDSVVISKDSKLLNDY